MKMDETVGWHHQLNGQEFEQTPGDSKGQGSQACCSPWHGVARSPTILGNWTTTPNARPVLVHGLLGTERHSRTEVEESKQSLICIYSHSPLVALPLELHFRSSVTLDSQRSMNPTTLESTWNHPSPLPFGLWKNCLPQNWSKNWSQKGWGPLT